MEYDKQEEEIEPLISELFVDESVRIKDKFSKLKGVNRLQKSIVRQNMHNAMSPISAICGYLELINMSLSQDPDVDQIEYYRKKIESGILEVNNIIEQLQGLYADDSDSIIDDNDDLIEVDLNWIVGEVCNHLQANKPNITFSTKASSLHVHTDLFICKLIIFNLVSYSVNNSSKDEAIEITTGKNDDMAIFAIAFPVSEKKIEELTRIITGEGLSELEDRITENSYNEGLLTSTRLARQVKGKISFLRTNKNSGLFKLYIPLSGM